MLQVIFDNTIVAVSIKTYTIDEYRANATIGPHVQV